LSAQTGTLQQLYLDNNEAAFCLAVVPFAARSNDYFLVLGTAKDTSLSPRTCTSGYLRTYAIAKDGRSLSLLHKVRHASGALTR
jgi:splicing factor 3B subunit 3